jgi:transposase
VKTLGRAIGLDVHLQFCEVAIVAAGAIRSAGRIETTPEKLELFARSLSPADRVALEVTGSAWAIAEIGAESWTRCGCPTRRPRCCAGA